MTPFPKPVIVSSLLLAFVHLVGCGGGSSAAPVVPPGVQFLPPLVSGGHVLPRAISSDGGTVVGQATDADGLWRAFRWSAATGTLPLGSLPGTSHETTAVSVSGDGSIVVGTSSDGQVTTSWSWTRDGGMREIAMPEAAGWSDVSQVTENGAWAVGRYLAAETGLLRVYVWSPSGGARTALELGADPDEVDRFYPAGITSDGFSVFLTSVAKVPGNGDGSWVFRYGLPYGQGIVTSHFMQPTMCLDCRLYLAPGAISRDGTAAAGSLTHVTDFTSPGVWFTGNELLQIAPPNWLDGMCISPGGTLVGGGAPNNGQAFLWSRTLGFLNLMTFLQEYDTVRGTHLADAFSGDVSRPASVVGIAASDTRITGLVRSSDGLQLRAYVIDVP